MSSKNVRYAVVGLGHIAQAAVLPAFANARRNSGLAAIVSGDPDKRRELSKLYDVPAYAYEEYEGLLASGLIDAVYIALPNTHHREATVRAAAHGIHVLCEKPMAPTVAECEEMIRACKRGGAKLMIAYRLHFDEANLGAVAHIRDGRIGEPRYFTSAFSYQVKEGNVRTRADLAGGALFDIGIYCVNAARYLFRQEPVEVTAFAIGGREPRFSVVEEAVAAAIRFPDERLASFVASFGAADASSYRIVGTKGDITVNPAYDYSVPLSVTLTSKGTSRRKRYKVRDQFAPELVYFSECILNDVHPEPDGREGLADVRVLAAIETSVLESRPVSLPPFVVQQRPDPDQALRRPAVREPELVHAEPPSTD